MSNNEQSKEPFRRFRTTTVRIGLTATLIIAAIIYLFNPIAAQGFLMGGFAGVLGFWIIAVRLQKLAFIAPQKVQFHAFTFTILRFALYGAVFYKTYSLDPESMHAVLGALAGIFVIRVVLLYMGITGLDIPETKKQDID